MNITEIVRYREGRETETQLEIDRTLLGQAVSERNAGRLGIDVDHYSLTEEERVAMTAMHIGQLKATHRMMRGLMLAPASDMLGRITIARPFPNYNVRTRVIQTPDIGDFVLGARVWSNKRITSPSSQLSLAYLHPRGNYPAFADYNRTEPIVSTQADSLTLSSTPSGSYTELTQAASNYEIVAAVCTQVGAETITAP